MYKIILEKSVQKFLEKHKGEDLISRFSHAITVLSVNPYENNLDIKILVGLPNSYRLRIGNYRFIYEIIDDILVINFFDAGNRGNIYKNIKK